MGNRISKNPIPRTTSPGIGVSSGLIVSVIAAVVPDGLAKNLLIIIASPIAILVSIFFDGVKYSINSLIKNLKVSNASKTLQLRAKNAMLDPHADEDTRRNAKEMINNMHNTLLKDGEENLNRAIEIKNIESKAANNKNPSRAPVDTHSANDLSPH